MDANYCSDSLYDMIVCPNDSLFQNEHCSYCSSANNNGTSLDCECKGYTFIKNCGRCCSCPTGRWKKKFQPNHLQMKTLISIRSWGDYPNCICEEPFQYNILINQCLQCPVYESEGIYPNCRCQNGLFSISEH